MTIEQCKFCNKPFQSVGGRICPNCLEQIDIDFITIRDYMYDHPGTFDVDSICKATEVPKAVVLHLIKEQRLTISKPGGGGVLTCSICHKPIAIGTICDDCKLSLSGTLGKSAVPPPAAPAPTKPVKGQRSSGKMHVWDSNDKKKRS